MTVGSSLWMIALIFVALYCGLQAVRDLRAKRWLLGLAGCACTAAILLMPIRTHAVKLDLPMAETR